MRVIFLVFTVSFNLLLSAQSTLKVKQFTTAQGLSQNSVNDIVEDQSGYIWVASQDGLNRFNGKIFKHFRHNKADSFSISDNFITRLLLDDSGRIWMCTRNFINVYDSASDRFHKLKIHNKNSIAFQLIKNGDYFYLQLIVEGVIKVFSIHQSEKFTNAFVDIEKISQQIINIDTHQSLSMLPTGADSLWLLNIDTSIQFPSYTKTKWDYPFFQDNQGIGLLHWNDTLTFLSDLNNIIAVNTKKKHVTVLHEKMSGYDFIAVDDDSIWIATNIGLFSSSVSKFNIHPVYFEGFNSTNVIFHCLFKDSYGQFWFGTANHGLFVHHTQSSQFQYLLIADDNPFIRDVQSVNGDIWMATDLGLNVRYKSGKTQRYFQGKKFTGINIHDQTIYAGTNEGMIHLINPENAEMDSIFLGKQAEITDIIPYNDNIYIISYSGLYEWNLDKGAIREFKKEFELITSYFLTGYVDQKNQLWVGHSSGCSKLTNHVWKHYQYVENSNQSPNFNFVSDFAEDQNDELWMATYGGGLSKLNDDDSFSHFTSENGLINDVVYSMVADEMGFFWLTTNAGITRFDPIKLKAVNFDINAGLKNYNFGISNMVLTPEQKIMSGTSEGVIMFDPNKVKPYSISPRMYWSEIMVNFERKILKSAPIILNSNRDVLSLQFDGLKYDLNHDVQYSYKLETENKWIPLPDQLDRIIYNSIPYGNHQILLKATSKGGHFEETVLTLDINVLTPYYKRWYFILIISILLFSIIGAAIYYYSQIKLKKKLAALEMKEKVRQERERISRDLHDSVGTHFAYIISKLDYLNMTWGQELMTEKKEYLSKLTEFTRSGMRMLRETIWVLDQDEVDAEGFKRKIEDHLTQCVSHQSIEYQFHFTCTFPKINARIAHNLFRIIQEAVSNSIRHADPSKIYVNLNFESPSIIHLAIEDDGKGFDTVHAQSAKAENYGIRNMKTRATEIAAQLNISSNKSGTKLTIISKK